MGEQQITDERPSSEAGFTLVELMVVVLVIGILVGFGIPTLLGARQRASDSLAKSHVRQALLTQKTFYTDRGTWGQASDIQPVEPSVQFADLGSSGPQVLGKVYVKVDGAVATLVSPSATGTCYWVREATSNGTTYATVPCATTPSEADFDDSW